MDADALRAEIIRLGPWHLDVEVTPEVSTAASLEAPPGTYDEAVFGPVRFGSYRTAFLTLLDALYPGGLAGRSVLDCACNAGAYLFWAKERGAGRCFGFDVRDHWINQAEFLAAHRTAPSDGIQFGVHDLYDVPQLGLAPFDVTVFKGILYHLPDPQKGLQVAADLTTELILVNTATMPGGTGRFVPATESTTRVMSGVHGTAWFPTGEEAVAELLAELGFTAVRGRHMRKDPSATRGRIELLAARDESTFGHFDRAGLAQWRRVTPPD